MLEYFIYFVIKDIQQIENFSKNYYNRTRNVALHRLALLQRDRHHFARPVKGRKPHAA